MSETKKLDPNAIGGTYLIPKDILRHPSGNPVRFIRHKQAFLDYCVANGTIGQPEAMDPEEAEDAYFKWLADNPQQEP